MKLIKIALCLALLGLLALPADALAATVGSPYKNGSLMVFPLVDVSDTADTVISITNSYYYETNVLCQFRSVSDQIAGSLFSVGPRKTVWFSMKTGDGTVPGALQVSEQGALQCWAVDAAGAQQISWNYLQGLARITDNEVDSWGYNSWNFAAKKARGKPVGTAGIIKLTGRSGQYDAMPKYLSFTVPSTVTEANLSLVLGKQDLRQEYENTYSKARFRYSKWGTTDTECIKDQAQSVPLPSALLGSFTVQGIASTVCDVQFGVPTNTTQNSPLLGVLQARWNSSPLTIMPNGVGVDGSGYLLWDPDSGTEEKSLR